jgi:mono/diheme cytochrome c family protein
MNNPGRLRATIAAVVALVIVFSLLIVVLVMHTTDDRKVNGQKLSSSEARGAQVFATTCQSCHTLKASNAVGTVGPSLDYVQPEVEQVEQVIAKGSQGANASMPSGLLTGSDVHDVAAYVNKVANRKNVN